MLRAIWALAARPQLVRRGPRLVGCFDRHRNLFIPQRDLLRLKLRLLPGQRRRDRASPLAVEIGGILLVDVLLFLRRRIRAHDIETSVLHEIKIGVAAARLAPSGKFRVAFEQRRSPRFLARRPLRAIGAFLEIGGACACGGGSAAQPAITAISRVDLRGTITFSPRRLRETPSPQIVAIMERLSSPVTPCIF